MSVEAALSFHANVHAVRPAAAFALTAPQRGEARPTRELMDQAYYTRCASGYQRGAVKHQSVDPDLHDSDCCKDGYLQQLGTVTLTQCCNRPSVRVGIRTG